MTNGISGKIGIPSKYINILESKIHYIEEGEGDPILFIHGIPTSCYVWRNIIPHLASLGRCIAPDLIGFGQSGKPNIDYSIQDHIKYINEFINKLNLKNITIVMHGWGSIIGLDYAMRNQKNCKGIVFYEAFLRSLGESEVALPFQEQLLDIQNAGSTELILDSPFFVDRIIPQNVMRQLSQEEMRHYREPFNTKGAGKPIIQFLHELTDTENLEKIISAYSELLVKSKVPKLMLYSIPGFITTIATVMWAKENLANLEVADIGEELHLAQESSPQLMGETISIWLQGIEALS